jgi:hypothetical protein
MTSEYFFFLFLLTVTVTRIVLSGKRAENSVLINNIHKHFHIHHFVYGILLISLGVYYHHLMTYAVGMGLFVDEIPLLIERNWTWGGYYSKGTFLFLLVLILAVFSFRNQLLSVL